MRRRVAPYLLRLGLTEGQAWTLALGLLLGGLLLAVSVPPVWERRSTPPPPPPAPSGASFDRPTVTPLRSTS